MYVCKITKKKHKCACVWIYEEEISNIQLKLLVFYSFPTYLNVNELPDSISTYENSWCGPKLVH